LRYPNDHQNLINDLREKYNYQVNQTTIDRIIGYADTIKIGGEYPAMDEIGK
jgi:hypothetical protein